MKKTWIITFLMFLATLSIVQAQQLRCDSPNTLNITVTDVGYGWQLEERYKENMLFPKIDLHSSRDLYDVQITVLLSGYEFNQAEELRRTIGPFDMDAGVTYFKGTSMALPKLIEEDFYKIRYIISDRFGQSVRCEGSLHVSPKRHEVYVRDIAFNPMNGVVAGRGLETKVLLRNDGERNEEGVKVSIIFPELGVGDSEFVDHILAGDELSVDDLYTMIPKCTKPGVYSGEIQIHFNELREYSTQPVEIEVTAGEQCPTSKTKKDTSTKDTVEVTMVNAPPVKEAKVAPSTTNWTQALILLIALFIVVLIVLAILFATRQE